MVFPLLIVVLVRWLVPYITEKQAPWFDLVPFYPLIISYFLVLLIPLMFGVVIGFLLLDERDDQTLTALQVTPLPLDSYLMYRIALPFMLSVLTAVVAVPLTGLVQVPFLPLLLVSLLASLEAPIFALALASIAENKVQGFALMKGSGVILLAPVAAYFVPSGLQLLFGIIPTYWPVKAFWVAAGGGSRYWPFLLAGLLYHLFLLKMLLQKFGRVIPR